MRGLLPSILALATLTAAHQAHSAGVRGESVAEKGLAGTPEQVLACIAGNSQRVSYPRGLAPGNQFRSTQGDKATLEQWFWHRNGGWVTHFDAEPDPMGTVVRVVIPVGYSLTSSYQQAAVQLIDYCAAHPAEIAAK